MTKLLNVGDVVHGFVNGVFGHDHFGCWRIEAICSDWIVVRCVEGDAVDFATLDAGSVELIVQARDEPCPEGCAFGNEHPRAIHGGNPQ